METISTITPQDSANKTAAISGDILPVKTVAKKYRGFSKIMLTTLMAYGTLLSWNYWQSSIYEAYAPNPKKIAISLNHLHQKDFDMAASLYLNGETIEATNIVSKHFKANKNNDELAFLYAQMLITSDYLHASRYVLNSIILRGDEKDKSEAAFLLALSYLKANEYANCERWLKKISKGTSKYAEAKALIFKIKPFLS